VRTGQVTDDVDDGAVGGPPMLSGAIAGDHELRVLAAFPMDDELDLLSTSQMPFPDDQPVFQRPSDGLAPDIDGEA
jgi:hypothetical protein